MEKDDKESILNDAQMSPDIGKANEYCTSPEEPAKPVLEADEYIEEVGDCGLYQFRTQVIFLLFMVVITSQIFISYFVVHDPPWQCKQNSTVCNFTSPISSHDHVNFREKCKMPRSEWEFTKHKEYSIVTQFELVCNREYYATVSHSLVFIGMGGGALIMTYLMDRFGRKTIIFPSVFAIIFSAILSVVANHLILFIVSRLVIGIALSGGVIFVLAAEISGPKYRALTSTMIWVYFSGVLVLLTGVAYLSQNWKTLELTFTVPFLLLIFTWRYFPESIRWMRMNDKLEEAEELLKSMAKINGKPVPNATLRRESQTHTTTTFLHLFYPMKVFTQTSIQSLAWFVSGLTYFAATFAAQDLSGNFYMDFILTSIIEVPANVAVIFFCDRIGRKRAVITHYYLASVACLIVSFTPLEPNGNTEKKFVRLAAGIIAKYAATCYFNSLYIWSAELYPTSIRAQAIGFLLAISRFGGSLAPMVITTLKYVNEAFPFLLMTILNIIAGTLCLYLGDTKDVHIPDTMEEYIDSL
ncbi:organic cation transporter protein-like [Hydractinia symbiolongicarpus]|uniref:organic cation transporter protein-like n=1 Tax=Hydractinia symbiolongicarpus TaxID=13093 RepID=UPI00254EC197|nr:organic cation transporter protein-like [Hydractinia symbiolongicarpus]